MKKTTHPFSLSIALLLVLASAAMAQSFDLSWYTIDGGGGTSAGGNFTLSGTIGQPDAGSPSSPLSGGNFALVGGFWPGAGSQCTMPGDMNQDGVVNGADVQLFVNCLIGSGGVNCTCADFDGGGAGPSDAQPFVTALLAG